MNFDSHCYALNTYSCVKPCRLIFCLGLNTISILNLTFWIAFFGMWMRVQTLHPLVIQYSTSLQIKGNQRLVCIMFNLKCSLLYLQFFCKPLFAIDVTYSVIYLDPKTLIPKPSTVKTWALDWVIIMEANALLNQHNARKAVTTLKR